jgi:hypothetical protein
MAHLDYCENLLQFATFLPSEPVDLFVAVLELEVPS